jgi:hypothetical protein
VGVGWVSAIKDKEEFGELNVTFLRASLLPGPKDDALFWLASLPIDSWPLEDGVMLGGWGWCPAVQSGN